MTLDERAEEAWQYYRAIRNPNWTDEQNIKATIRGAVSSAISEERERCARVAEERGCETTHMCCERVAKKIREGWERTMSAPKPGPSLDRLVMDKVMRWYVDDTRIDALIGSGPHSATRVDWWSPSTNLAHAWEVVEKLGLLRFPRSLQQSAQPPFRWFVEEYCGEVAENLGIGDTACHAICLAALKMIEEGEGKRAELCRKCGKLGAGMSGVCPVCLLAQGSH